MFLAIGGVFVDVAILFVVIVIVMVITILDIQVQAAAEATDPNCHLNSSFSGQGETFIFSA